VSPSLICKIFVALRLLQFAVEHGLAALNRRYYLRGEHQREAQALLAISADEMRKSVAYSEDKYRFGVLSESVSLLVTLVFLMSGGFGLVEGAAITLGGFAGGSVVIIGVVFFALLLGASMLVGLPFEYYRTFVIEARHGFNRQTPGGFWLDRLKGVVLGAVLGLPLLALILWLMVAAGPFWWVYAWGSMSAFSILTAWLYPTFLAPLFNKFSPVQDQTLLDQIHALAIRVGFQAAGISVMDASKRSSHGNAYFTGVFGKKRIVLFDTLVQAMGASEVVAVLAHELGHFKLHHVRWGLLRGILMTGVTFYLLSLCLPLVDVYLAFGLSGPSPYGALLVFGMWFGLLSFCLQPFGNWLSQRHEFAADHFATQHLESSKLLGTALLKLRETSAGMPISHPWYSTVYHSHPPLLTRLVALGYSA
jgi:STE24 endopeptidase